MSDAIEVKRWWVRMKNYNGSPVKRDRDRLCCDYEPEPSRLEMFVEVMRVKDHDRIVAKQKRVIEKLREQRNIENGAKWNARGLGTVSGISEIEKMDAQIAAIEQGEGM